MARPRTRPDRDTALARALQDYAERTGSSQKEVAAALDKHESTVSLWFRGIHAPRPSRALVGDLARLLDRTEQEVREILLGSQAPADAERGVLEDAEKVWTFLRDTCAPELHRSMSADVVSLDGILALASDEGMSVPEALEKELLEYAKQHEVGLPTGSGAQWEIQERSLVRRNASAQAVKDFLRRLSRADPDDPSAALHAFRESFRRNAWIRSVIREASADVNAAFEKRSVEVLPSAEVLDRIRRAGSGVGHEARAAVARTLLGAFETLRLLERDGDLLRRRWALSPSYVLNRLFGVVPQVPGLDFLLDGGLLPASGTGLSLLVEGEPGVGKTTLALQLAASLASSGYAVVYLAAEESAHFLEDRLSFVGYRWSDGLVSPDRSGEPDQPDRWVPARAPFEFETVSEPPKSSEPDRGRAQAVGCVTVVTVADRERGLDRKSELVTKLQRRFRDLAESGTPTCLVVDSIDALLPQAPRAQFEELFNFARAHTEFGIFVAEEGGWRGRKSIEYLVDVVMKLEYRARLDWFSERVLEITKCRSQAHVRGQHMFSVHTGMGITIYPSVQSKLSVWRRRIRRAASAEPESWRLDDSFDYDPVLSGDIVQGDSILLSGDPATHKFPVGLSFLASALSPGSAEDEGYHLDADSLLLISLREDEASIRRTIGNYPQFKPLAEALRPRYDRSPLLSVMHFPPDYFSAERFVHWVERTLRQLKRKRRVRRVLFSTLSQLEHNSPMFGKEPLFIATLIELFKKEGITSLFLSVEDSRTREIGNVFDAILFTTKHPAKAAEGRITLSVGHSGPCNAVRSPMPLRRRTRSGSGWLELDTSSIPSHIDGAIER